MFTITQYTAKTMLHFLVIYSHQVPHLWYLVTITAVFLCAINPSLHSVVPCLLFIPKSTGNPW